MRRLAVVVGLLALLVAASEAYGAPRGRRGRSRTSTRFEVSIAHNVYPRQPNMMAGMVSVRFAECSGVNLFADAGFGTLKPTKKYADAEGFVIGLSGGQPRARWRYGVGCRPRNGDVLGYVRVRVIGW